MRVPPETPWRDAAVSYSTFPGFMRCQGAHRAKWPRFVRAQIVGYRPIPSMRMVAWSPMRERIDDRTGAR